MADDHKILLSESELPHAWYNIMADMPVEVSPPLHPATHQPLGPQDLAPLFPMALIQQEASTERYIEIPGAVRDILRIWRPSPLHRAINLEKALGTPARIYYKNEGVSPAGSHKPNTAVAQAYYNKMEGVRTLTTETGAGQWGCALAFACQLFGLECRVWMVKVSYHQKPYRRSLMQLWGASVMASPSDTTEAGRAALRRDPNTTGSLAMAISEAVEVAAQDPDARYSLGSVLNHVLLHQTVIGEECLKAMQIIGDYPDVVIGCVGGGSNFGGIAFPFIREKLQRDLDTQFIAVEPTACPTLTKGVYAYDFGDVSGHTPLLKMMTLGHNFVPSGIHAGGLRYHGMATQVSALVNAGIIEGRAVTQASVFEAAAMFARTEGIVPAPESSHAIRAAIDEALKAKETGEEKCILFNLSGNGHFDMAAYDNYLSGKLEDSSSQQETIAQSLATLPVVD